MRRDRCDITRALKRVTADERAGDLLALREAGELLGAPANTVRRWIVDGHRGGHLDGACRAGEWYTSRRACCAFLRHLYELDAEGWAGRALF